MNYQSAHQCLCSSLRMGMAVGVGKKTWVREEPPGCEKNPLGTRRTPWPLSQGEELWFCIEGCVTVLLLDHVTSYICM